MRMWKIIGLGLLVAIFWTATGFSFPHAGMGRDGAGLGGPGLWRLLRALNLTDTQKTQVHDLFAAHRSTVQPLWEQMRATRQDRKSTRLNSSHDQISYAVFCLKKKKSWPRGRRARRTLRLSRPWASQQPRKSRMHI